MLMRDSSVIEIFLLLLRRRDKIINKYNYY